MEFKNVGILGAGVMGKQIALLCASRGMSVIVWNHLPQAEFEKEIRRLALLEAKLGRIDKTVVQNVVGAISLQSDLSALGTSDLFIEAVKEDQKIKRNVLRELGAIVKGDQVICSNTSTLSITELSLELKTPGSLIGAHFFNPPLLMKLVEVVRGEYTSNNTLSTALRFIDCLQKIPVVLPETPGFIVNRLLFTMINEAIYMFSDGIADARTIDNCMRMGANHPMGPLELADFIGLDVCLSILETLVSKTGDIKYRPAPLLQEYVHANRLGRKTGIGFFSYAAKGKK